MAMVARRYFVKGTVQEVGFRLFTAETARRDGLRGFVRNCYDGRVEAVIEGDEEKVSRFERAIRAGPPLADVEGIEVEALEPTGRYGGFEIRG